MNRLNSDRQIPQIIILDFGSANILHRFADLINTLDCRFM